MLIFCVCMLALAASGGLCAALSAFGSFMWLWLLPVGFVVGVLLLAGLWYLLLLAMASAVNMESVDERKEPFYRGVAMLTVKALVPILKIRIETRGLEQLPGDGRFLLVCNHIHDTDPVVLLWAFPKSRLAFISKREADAKFLVGPFLRQILCQPINRENDREALKTILNCIKLLKDDRVSIGVFPEGYIHGDDLLHPFRSGVFKIAQKANVPVVVCTIQGTQKIFRNIKTWTGTSVKLHLVGVISTEEQQGRTAVDIARQAHDMMAGDLGPELVLPVTEEECQ